MSTPLVNKLWIADSTKQDGVDEAVINMEMLLHQLCLNESGANDAAYVLDLLVNHFLKYFRRSPSKVGTGSGRIIRVLRSISLWLLCSFPFLFGLSPLIDEWLCMAIKDTIASLRLVFNIIIISPCGRSGTALVTISGARLMNYGTRSSIHIYHEYKAWMSNLVVSTSLGYMLTLLAG